MSSARKLQHPLREYVYGRHAVHSALLANKRRSFDRLLLHNPKENMKPILKLASKYGIRVSEKPSRSELDRLTHNGVHNGIVLETDRIRIPLLKDLGPVNPDGSYTVSQFTPQETNVVEKSCKVARAAPRTKHPLGIYIDEVTDPHNAGAIIRTSYFLGADFIIFPDHTTARLGPVTAKTSAGALDLMNLYQVKSSLSFLNRVQKNGHWKLIATDSGSDKQMPEKDISSALDKSAVLLVLGSEGSGVRASIKNLCSNYVRLDKQGPTDPIVDSLNVSVACGVMLSKFLQTPSSS